jgi:hypothetical protein
VPPRYEPHHSDARTEWERCRERPAAREKRANPPPLKRDELAHGPTRALRNEVCGLAARPCHVVRRHVDTTSRGILAEVLEMFHELQPDADLIRQRDPLR